ncbi:MAG: hypothetical protein LQ342_001772 [Letrouitia transgressa]|nr:MAG: hypothetical protein LQ342_001772 [Letrouitia transgressa]
MDKQQVRKETELLQATRRVMYIVAKLQDFPKGFPKLACFLDSDDAFMVYRRFGIVFSRLILNKQDEIREMEDTLACMDRSDERRNPQEVYLKSRIEDQNRSRSTIPQTWLETRPQLLERLEKKTLEYADLLLKAKQLKGLKKPSLRDYKSIIRFMENDGGQLYEEEAGWVYQKEDLITLRPGREHAWLDTTLERVLRVCRCKLIEETKAKTDDKAIHYYDRQRIATCVTMITSAVVLILLIIPIWLLYRFSLEGKILKETPDTMLTVLCFTLIFSAALSVFTEAKRHEIVAASAGVKGIVLC